MSLLPFWALKVVIALLSVEGSESSQISSKIPSFVFWRWMEVYRFGTTWGWI